MRQRPSSPHSDQLRLLQGKPLANVSLRELAARLEREIGNNLDALSGGGANLQWELRGIEDKQGQPLRPLDSAALAPWHWQAIFRGIRRNYNDYDGFVVIHGTDTLAYTASALSFLFEALDKPVVLTGSQLPIFESRNDARMNFIHALMVAGWRWSGLVKIPEVMIAFGERLLRGNRSRKVSTTGWQGFDSPNFPWLGQLAESVRIHQAYAEGPGFRFPVSPLGHRCEEPPEEAGPLEDRVLDLTLFPGIRAAHLSALLLQEDLKGLLLRCYGSGNAPDDPLLLLELQKAHSRGVQIVVVSQCNEATVDLGRYATSQGLADCGAISGFDLTPEAALTKMMWLLGRCRDSEVDFRSHFRQDNRGEQSFSEYSWPLGPDGCLHFQKQGLASHARLQRAYLHLQVASEQAYSVELREFQGQESVKCLFRSEMVAGPSTVLDLTSRLSPAVSALQTDRSGLSYRLTVRNDMTPVTGHLDLQFSSF